MGGNTYFSYKSKRKDIRKLSNNGHAFAISTEKLLYGWGIGLQGRIGNGATANVLSPTQVTDFLWHCIGAGNGHSGGIIIKMLDMEEA